MNIKKDFTQIPNDLLRTSHLTLPARYLLCVLVRYMMQNELCFPSQATLAKDLSYSDRHIRNLLDELQRKNYIRVARTGFNKSNTYVLGSAIEWKHSSYHIGKAIPNHQGNGIPTNNTNRRIINKNNLIKINKIKRECSDKIGRFDNL